MKWAHFSYFAYANEINVHLLSKLYPAIFTRETSFKTDYGENTIKLIWLLWNTRRQVLARMVANHAIPKYESRTETRRHAGSMALADSRWSYKGSCGLLSRKRLQPVQVAWRKMSVTLPGTTLDLPVRKIHFRPGYSRKKICTRADRPGKSQPPSNLSNKGVFDLVALGELIPAVEHLPLECSARRLRFCFMSPQ